MTERKILTVISVWTAKLQMVMKLTRRKYSGRPQESLILEHCVFKATEKQSSLVNCMTKSCKIKHGYLTGMQQNFWISSFWCVCYVCYVIYCVNIRSSSVGKDPIWCKFVTHKHSQRCCRLIDCKYKNKPVIQYFSAYLSSIVFWHCKM